jgi:hypothetical protein
MLFPSMGSPLNHGYSQWKQWLDESRIIIYADQSGIIDHSWNAKMSTPLVDSTKVKRHHKSDGAGAGGGGGSFKPQFYTPQLPSWRL